MLALLAEYTYAMPDRSKNKDQTKRVTKLPDQLLCHRNNDAIFCLTK